MSKITTDFIKSLRKMYEEVGALLTETKAMQRDVQTIRERIVEESDKTRSDNQASDTQNDAPIVPTSRTTKSKGKKKSPENQEEGFLYNQYSRWKNQLAKPRFQVSLLTLIFLITYTCETSRTNTLTEKSLDVTRDSIAAQIFVKEWDFPYPIVQGKQIGVAGVFDNVGHSPALYGIEADAFRWSEMPDSIPIEAPKPTDFLEPGKPLFQYINDTSIATEEFIYSIPHLREMKNNPATRHVEPPLPRPTVFFIGRLVYESLGLKTEKQFCFFMVYADGATAIKPKTDDRFVFVTCPKWNTVVTTKIE